MSYVGMIVPSTLMGMLVLAGLMVYANVHDAIRYWFEVIHA